MRTFLFTIIRCLLATLGMFPVVGIPFALTSLAWAFADHRSSRDQAAVLMGLAGVLGLSVSGISLLLRPDPVTEMEKKAFLEKLARQDLVHFASDLDRLRNMQGRYPSNLEAVRASRHERIDPVASYGDPDGVEYHYRASASGDRYELFSTGWDGVAFTEDDIRVP